MPQLQAGPAGAATATLAGVTARPRTPRGRARTPRPTGRRPTAAGPPGGGHRRCGWPGGHRSAGRPAGRRPRWHRRLLPAPAVARCPPGRPDCWAGVPTGPDGGLGRPARRLTGGRRPDRRSGDEPGSGRCPAVRRSAGRSAARRSAARSAWPRLRGPVRSGRALARARRTRGRPAPPAGRGRCSLRTATGPGRGPGRVLRGDRRGLGVGCRRGVLGPHRGLGPVAHAALRPGAGLPPPSRPAPPGGVATAHRWSISRPGGPHDPIRGTAFAPA